MISEMGFTLNLSSCVAAGRFNPAILVPEWVVKHGILPDAEVEAQSLLGSGVTIFGMHGLQWRATLARLDVAAEKEGANPGDFVAKILELLSHTPIKAVGNNFQFSVTSSAETIYSLVKFDLLERIASQSHALVGGTSIAAYSHEDAVMRLSLHFEGTKVTLIDFNFNRESQTAADGASAARRWLDDKQEALKIIRSLIGD